jgi:hypothetical protein
MLGPCQWDRRGGPRIHRPATWTPPVALLYASRVSNRRWLQVGVVIGAWRRPQVDMQPQTELARSLASEIAPGELPLFEIMSQSFAANPKRVRIRRGGDEELGFGIAESAVLVTPVALAAIREISLFLSRRLRQGTVTCSRRRWRGTHHQAVPKGVRHAAADGYSNCKHSQHCGRSCANFQVG